MYVDGLSLNLQIISIEIWISSKISNTFLCLLSNKILVICAGIHKILGRIANREDPDQGRT